MKINITKLISYEVEELKIYSWPIWTFEISEFNWEYVEEDATGMAFVVITNFETVSFSRGDFVVFPNGLKCPWIVSRAVQKHYRFI